MTPGRIKKLEKIGFVFRVRDDASGSARSATPRRGPTASWSQRYEELKEFKKEHGHCLVPWKPKEQDDEAD